MKKTRNSREWIRVVNIVFLILVLLFIGNTLYGLIFKSDYTKYIWGSGLLMLILLNSWILALRPFYDKNENRKKSNL